ncbi:MAG: hypothetical protein Q9183_006360 [Haloplaca sp. 2 TL-2023]
MTRRGCALSILLLFLLSALTNQVTIRALPWDEDEEIWCHDLEPGECCTVTTPNEDNINANPRIWECPGAVEIRDLAANEIAAIWGQIHHNSDPDPGFPGAHETSTTTPGCSQAPILVTHGPAAARYHESWLDDGDEINYCFEGVSYIRLPASSELPHDRMSREALTAQGILGMVWPQRLMLPSLFDTWISDEAIGRLVTSAGQMGRRDALGTGSSDRRPSKLPGRAYIGPPPRQRFPDMIKANGTEYVSRDTSELRYVSEDGQVLNRGSKRRDPSSKN